MSNQQQPPGTPAMTSAKVPQPQPQVSVPLPYADIEAKPLRSPNFINLFPRNGNLCVRWVNRAVGERESQMRYDQCLAMGFINALPTDIYMVNPETGVRTDCAQSLIRDGKIMYGDLILMKIPRVDYLGALKWNEQSARRRVKKPGVSIEGDKGGDARVNPSNVMPQHPKIQPYIPDLVETDAKTADNTGSINLADAKPLR